MIATYLPNLSFVSFTIDFLEFPKNAKIVHVELIIYACISNFESIFVFQNFFVLKQESIKMKASVLKELQLYNIIIYMYIEP